MEDPNKHDKKKKNNTNKTLPLAINIGAGRFGIGGIVLLGGALVTATIVSALAFKTKSQRRSSSENMKKTVSPSPETHKEFCVDSSPLEVHNSSDDVTSMNEIRTKSIQSLTQDETHNCVLSGDDNEDMIVSVVVEDQENTSIHVDSGSESEEVDDDYEKIDLDSEERVAIAAQIEADSCLERDVGNENEHVDANSSVSEEGVASIEEHEAIEAEASENEDEDHQEMVFMNEAAAMEAACVNQFIEESEKDCNDEIMVENHLSDETGYADQIEVMGEEEVIKSACGNLVNMEDNLEIADHEVAQEMQVSQICETFVVECVMNRLKEAVDDQTTAKEDAPLTRLTNKLLIEATEVDDQTHYPPIKSMNKEEKEEEMITEHELVKKDEIAHVQSVEEDVTVKAELSSQEELTPEAKISNHKTEENTEEDQTILGENQNDEGASTEEKHAFASEPWDLKLMIWAVLISVWCICHWYSELPFPELSLAGSLFILMLLGYRNRATYASTSSFLANHKSGILG